MQAMMDQVLQFVGDRAPIILVALGVLVGGWIVALMAAWATRGILHRTTLDNRLAEWVFGEEKAGKIEIERFAGQLVFSSPGGRTARASSWKPSSWLQPWSWPASADDTRRPGAPGPNAS